MQCGHPKTKVEFYWSDIQKGWWSQCQVCDAYTAAFKKKEDSWSALKRMEREKPGGSPTDKGGRPKELPAGAKLCTFMLCPSHKKTLDQYQKHNELRSRAEALRHLLENLPVSMLADAAI